MVAQQLAVVIHFLVNILYLMVDRPFELALYKMNTSGNTSHILPVFGRKGCLKYPSFGFYNDTKL